MGGEKWPFGDIHGLVRGSPPRGRGKAAVDDYWCVKVGITPAWAGKRSTTQILRYLYGDHPRVGGEKFRDQNVQNAAKGSPPRGRGKVLFCAFACIFARITPAWAGKSSRPGLLFEIPRDHPRVGGEKFTAWATLTAKQRITPAWAGKSVCRRLSSLVRRDHPRVGGEKTKKIP